MNTNDVARIASLLGKPARAAMLLALMDGRSLTANELAKAGNVSPQTTSRHLTQMVEAGLMNLEPCGHGCANVSRPSGSSKMEHHHSPQHHRSPAMWVCSA